MKRQINEEESVIGQDFSADVWCVSETNKWQRWSVAGTKIPSALPTRRPCVSMVFQQINDKVAYEGMCQGRQKEFSPNG